MNRSLASAIMMCGSLGAIGADKLDPPFTFQTEVVICVLRPDHPWQQVGRGILKRGSSENRTDYAFSSEKGSFRWWWRTNPDGSTTGAGGPSLGAYLSPYIPLGRNRDVYPPDPMRTGGDPAPTCDYWSRALKTGEIHDRCGPFEARSIIGTECPRT